MRRIIAFCFSLPLIAISIVNYALGFALRLVEFIAGPDTFRAISDAIAIPRDVSGRALPSALVNAMRHEAQMPRMSAPRGT